MKKIFNMMMAAAIAAFTFTACEDVPEPYNNPYDSKTEDPGVTVEPTGDGSEATPWNVVAALDACADLGAGEYINNGDDVYVTGVIVQIDELSTSYGNATYYISDNLKSGYQLEIYRGYSMGGEKFTSDSEIEVGDSVTVCGKIVFYNGSVLEFTTGSKLVYLKKGEGGGNNNEKPETTTVGTKDAPKTVAEALTAINGMSDGATSTEYWFVKGKVVKVTTSQENFEKYGNLNYLISEDGTETNTITVYSGNGLDNELFSGIDALKAGDEVVVYGQLQKYVSSSGAMTPEIAKGNYLVKYTPAGGNGDNEEQPGTNTGTIDNPLTASQAYDIVSAMPADQTSTADYYVKGKICSIKYTFSAQYGTATFNISDDGNASDKEFIAYSCLYFNGEKWQEGDTQISVGDEVLVCGKVINYYGNTPEFSSQKNHLVSLNGNTGGGNTGDNSGAGTTTTITMADFGLDDATELTTLSANGVTLTFSPEGGSTTPKYYANGKAARMYALNSLTITDSKAIAKVVLTCAMNGTNPANGNDMMYGEANGTKVTTSKDSNTQVTFSNFSSNTLKIVNDYTAASAGTQLRIVSIQITYAN